MRFWVLFLVSALVAPVPALALTRYQVRYYYYPTFYSPAPAPAPAPAPTPVATSPSGDFVSQVEQYVLQDINAQRAQNGLAALAPNSTLGNVARAHSEDMLAHNYFSHNDLLGCDPGCRITKAGFTWHSYGENIYMMSGYNLSAAASATQIVTAWTNSPGHRANILGAFTMAGAGIASSGSTVYATVDFATP
jgi:uncharacterized protein YkwD